MVSFPSAGDNNPFMVGGGGGGGMNHNGFMSMSSGGMMGQQQQQQPHIPPTASIILPNACRRCHHVGCDVKVLECGCLFHAVRILLL
jgi:hypothetical protein